MASDKRIQESKATAWFTYPMHDANSTVALTAEQRRDAEQPPSGSINELEWSRSED